jgi:hypothetical protein
MRLVGRFDARLALLQAHVTANGAAANNTASNNTASLHAHATANNRNRNSSRNRDMTASTQQRPAARLAARVFARVRRAPSRAVRAEGGREREPEPERDPAWAASLVDQLRVRTTRHPWALMTWPDDVA